jgi:hypothetical protein
MEHGADRAVSGREAEDLVVEIRGVECSTYDFRFLFSYHERQSLSRWGIRGVNTRYCGGGRGLIY